MEFENTPQKETYEKITPWMKEIFGDFCRLRDNDPAFGINYGSSYTYVRVNPWGDDDAVINTRSYVVTKVEVTPELMDFLLHENDTMRFGAFGLDKDNDVFFEHAILGSTCDKEELRSSILAVMYTADKYDDKIMSRWGGQRAEDR